MPHVFTKPRRTSYRRVAVFVFVLTSLGGAVAVIGWQLRGGPDAPPRMPVAPGTSRVHHATSFKYARTDYPVLQAAPAVPAAAAALADEAEVIGVTAGARHRAYALDGLGAEHAHVLNDLVDGVPYTVTYCPRDNCAHLFTDPHGGTPLRVSVGGWDPDRGAMLLRVDAAFFWHKTLQPLRGEGAAFPYAEAEFERTTWGRWREAHPDTDVCAGE